MFVECYLYFFEELAGLSVLEGVYVFSTEDTS